MKKGRFGLGKHVKIQQGGSLGKGYGGKESREDVEGLEGKSKRKVLELKWLKQNCS